VAAVTTKEIIKYSTCFYSMFGDELQILGGCYVAQVDAVSADGVLVDPMEGLVF
jgi:hypothetical protein